MNADKPFPDCDWTEAELRLLTVENLCEEYHFVRKYSYGAGTSAPKAIIAELERRIAGDA